MLCVVVFVSVFGSLFIYAVRLLPVSIPLLSIQHFFSMCFSYTLVYLFSSWDPRCSLLIFVSFVFFMFTVVCVCVFFFFACLCFCSRGVGRRCIISALRRRLEFQHLFLLFYFIVFVLFTIAVCYPSCLCRPNVYVRSIQANCSFKIVVIVRYKTDGCQWERDLKSVSYQRLDLAGT